MPREKKNDMRLRVLRERLDWMVENHQVKVQQKTFNFVNDCINRLLRGKGLSPGQRRWADSIIEEGLQKVEVPAKNRKLHARIEAALKMEHAAHNHNVLGEFAVKLARGWDLSEKQLSWCEAMLAEADAGPWVPTEAEMQVMQDLMNLRNSRNSYWYQNNPGTARAMEEISNFLAHGLPIRKFRFEKASKSFNGKLKELKSPRFNVGDKAFFVNKKSPAIVLTAPYTDIEYRNVCYDILYEGEVVKASTGNLRKRRG